MYYIGLSEYQRDLLNSILKYIDKYMDKLEPYVNLNVYSPADGDRGGFDLYIDYVGLSRKDDGVFIYEVDDDFVELLADIYTVASANNTTAEWDDISETILIDELSVDPDAGQLFARPMGLQFFVDYVMQPAKLDLDREPCFAAYTIED